MLFMYFIGDLFYLSHFFGSDPSSILTTLKGNEEEFIEPLSAISILEHIHISMFLSIMALFTTMAIVLRLNISKRHKGIIIFISMFSLLISSISFLTTYYLSDIFVYLFFTGTIFWHLSGIYALILIFTQLWTKKA